MHPCATLWAGFKALNVSRQPPPGRSEAGSHRSAQNGAYAVSPYEPIGYLASLLVLATFCMRSMLGLRMLAIASNVAFLAYAAFAGIHPVLVLHALLLPINAWRLLETMVTREPAPRA